MPPSRLLAFLILLAGLLSTSNAADLPQVKIGAIASLTGPAGEQGKNWSNGAIMAAEELATAGNLVRLIIEDDASTPSKVVSSFQKLVNQDKVQAIIGGTWDYLGEAAYPLARQYKRPFITPTNPVEILSPEALKNPFVFSNGLTVAAEKVAVRDFLKLKNPKRVALFYPNLPWGEVHANMLQELSRELGFEVVYDEKFSYEGYPQVIRVVLPRMLAQKPDLIFAPIDYNGLDILTSECERLKANPIVLVTQHLDTALEFSKSPRRYSKVYGIYPQAIDNENFAFKYLKRFGTRPKVYAAEGYDALMFLVKVLQSGVDLSEASTFTYQGVTGLHVLGAKRPRLVANEAIIMGVIDGRFSRVTGIPGEFAGQKLTQ